MIRRDFEIWYPRQGSNLHCYGLEDRCLIQLGYGGFCLQLQYKWFHKVINLKIWRPVNFTPNLGNWGV